MVLDAAAAAKALTEGAQEFERRAGRRPRSLQELHAAGLARAPLVDPSGVPFDMMSRRSGWRCRGGRSCGGTTCGGRGR